MAQLNTSLLSTSDHNVSQNRNAVSPNHHAVSPSHNAVSPTSSANSAGSASSSKAASTTHTPPANLCYDLSAALISFTALKDSIPSWLARLDVLAAKATERQTEFARLSSQARHEPARRKLKRSSSTESLRPAAAHNHDLATQDPEPDDTSAAVPKLTSSAPQHLSSSPLFTSPHPKANNGPQQSQHLKANDSHQKPSSPVIDANDGLRHSFEPTPRNLKRKRTPPKLSESPKPLQSQSRRPVVLYDSEVQRGFEWLVRSIASTRSKLRKGRITATAAARMASLGLAGSYFATERLENGRRCPLPSSHARHTINEQPAALPGQPAVDPALAATSPAAKDSPEFQAQDTSFDVADTLKAFDRFDRYLESAQSLCEAGAHQFLRQGVCAHELARIRDCLETCRLNVNTQLDVIHTQNENPHTQCLINEVSTDRSGNSTTSRHGEPVQSTAEDLSGSSNEGPVSLAVDPDYLCHSGLPIVDPAYTAQIMTSSDVRGQSDIKRKETSSAAPKSPDAAAAADIVTSDAQAVGPLSSDNLAEQPSTIACPTGDLPALVSDAPTSSPSICALASTLPPPEPSPCIPTEGSSSPAYKGIACPGLGSRPSKAGIMFYGEIKSTLLGPDLEVDEQSGPGVHVDLRMFRRTRWGRDIGCIETSI